MKEDIHNFNKRLETESTKIISSIELSKDKIDIQNFYRSLIADGISAGRIIKYLYSIKTLAKLLGKSFRAASKDDLIELIGKIERNENWADFTKHDFKVTIKKYYKWLDGIPNNIKTYPEIVSWISITMKNGSKKLPKEILIEDEIKKLCETAYTTRDKAFVLALYESGCRIGEFLPLRLKDIEFDKYGLVINVSGKTGDRRIRLVASSLAIKKWLEEHPYKHDQNSYLWVELTRQKESKYLRYQSVAKMLRELAKACGIKKKINPHNFRHARATFLANKLTDAQLKEYFGWTKGSDMTEIYTHLSGRDIDNSILKMHGILSEDKTNPTITIIKCPKCREDNEPSLMFCGKCGTPLNDNKLDDIMVRFLQAVAETNPELKAKFREIVKEENAMDIFDG